MTRADLMRSYKAEGHTAKEVAIHFGVSSDYVRRVCSGIAPQDGRNSDKEVAQRLLEKSNGQFVYISGYVNKESTVKVKCSVCGNTFERTYHHLTTHPNGCPKCVEIERKHNEANKLKRQEQRKRNALVNKTKSAKQSSLKLCKYCGEPFITFDSRLAYCSKECAKKSSTSYAKSSDDRLNSNNIVDKDITLERLYKRDGGICQICGKPCDYSDHWYTDSGAFVTGRMYPSKDHIVPLSKGGEHSWKNIRLAHRKCNEEEFWRSQRFMPPCREE